jgi:hypothetical protein
VHSWLPNFLHDGIIEAQNKNSELFGFDRARDILLNPLPRLQSQRGALANWTTLLWFQSNGSESMKQSPSGTDASPAPEIV